MALGHHNSNDYATPQDVQGSDKQAEAYINSAVDRDPTYLRPNQEPSGRKPLVLALGILLGIMTILAAVAAGVGGSLGSKQKHE